MKQDNWFQLNKMGGFGDLVMMTALFPEIKKRGFKLRCVVSTDYGQILENHPMIDQLVQLPPDRFWELRNQFDSMHAYDLLYPEWWGQVGTHKLDTHIIDLWFAQTELKEYVHKQHIPDLGFTEPFKSKGGFRVVYQMESGWSPYKNWSIQNWAHLDILISRHLPNVRFNIIPQLQDIKESFNLIRKSDLFIGPDSVFQHVAKAVGTKAIILWGSTNPEAFGYDGHVNMVNGQVWRRGDTTQKLVCQPCYREYIHIQQGDKCIWGIDNTPRCQITTTPEQVFEQVKLILGEPK